MQHISTRGRAAPLSFEDALLAGLATDGGLYVPEVFPTLTHEQIKAFTGKSYVDVATTVIGTLTDWEVPENELRLLLQQAYQPFQHPAIAPLMPLDANLYVLELFHGPTLAFKDFAMRALEKLMVRALAKRGDTLTIVGATSGDTGSAAIDAFRGAPNIKVVILYPNGRVSSVQRRQMTTPPESNVTTLAIDGTFDDAQALVKAMFAHEAFRTRVKLAGINSINWARIVAQVVYYFTAAVALGSPHRKVSFSVPTGNFGDILAGYIAKRMGLPIERLVIASNANDILPRTLHTGIYRMAGVSQTHSPSMDIQVSSNFERLLFELYDRDAEAVSGLMDQLRDKKEFALSDTALERLRADFDAHAVKDPLPTIREVYHALHGRYILDPHTAIGVVAGREAQKHAPEVPMVVLGTAHPAKFPDAVKEALGDVTVPTPSFLDAALSGVERVHPISAEQAVVEEAILKFVAA
jgi:threonine synthase